MFQEIISTIIIFFVGVFGTHQQIVSIIHTQSTPAIASDVLQGATSSPDSNLASSSTPPVLTVGANITKPTRAPNGDFSWVSISALPLLYTEKGNYIYIKGSIIPDADPESFAAAVDEAGIPIQYAKDKNHVYYFYVGWNNDADPEHVSAFNPVIIADADPATFTPIFGTPVSDLSIQQIDAIIGPTHNWQCLYDAYGRDSRHVYFQNNAIPGADPNTFSIIFDSNGCPTNFDMDKQHIYYDLNQDGLAITLPISIDRGTFRVLNDFYVEDKNGIYNKYGFPVSTSSTTFQVLRTPMSCGPNCLYDAYDNTNKYFLGNAVE